MCKAILLLLALLFLSSVAASNGLDDEQNINTGQILDQNEVPAVCLEPPAEGSELVDPVHYSSVNGILNVTLSFYAFIDDDGLEGFCYVSDKGDRSPTLLLRPGDILFLEVHNNVTASSGGFDATNVHFHGFAVSPLKPSDNIVMTSIEPGESYTYEVHIPTSHPPGLYWYHPHVYPFSEAGVLGGASGAIIIEGIEEYAPEVSGLDSAVVVVRGNVDPLFGNGTDAPTWDLSVNFIPVDYPAYPPAIMTVKPSEQFFLRVVNAHADAILSLSLIYDSVPQSFQVVAVDGVVLSNNVSSSVSEVTSFVVPPAARVEIVFTTPSFQIQNASLVTSMIDTGPDGDVDPTRELIQFVASDNATHRHVIPASHRHAPQPALQDSSSLRSLVPTVNRTLTFSEVISDPSDPSSPTFFYITVDGETPHLFNATSPAEVVTTRGSIEDWTIVNQAEEVHIFHIHQVHFLQIAANGVPLDYLAPLQDTILVPYYNNETAEEAGAGPSIEPAYPSVTLRMDFSNIDVGEFVFHCHILGHEDNGMMAKILVLPAPEGQFNALLEQTQGQSPVTVGVTVTGAVFLVGAGCLVVVIGMDLMVGLVMRMKRRNTARVEPDVEGA